AVGAEDAASEFSATRTQQPRQPQDFAAPDSQARILHAQPAFESGDGQSVRTWMVDARVPHRLKRGQLASEHGLDQRQLVETLELAFGHRLTVAHHGDALADGIEFIEL